MMIRGIRWTCGGDMAGGGSAGVSVGVSSPAGEEDGEDGEAIVAVV